MRSAAMPVKRKRKVPDAEEQQSTFKMTRYRNTSGSVLGSGHQTQVVGACERLMVEMLPFVLQSGFSLCAFCRAGNVKMSSNARFSFWSLQVDATSGS